MIAIGEQRHQRVEHARRRWKAVQQQDGRTRARTSLAIEDVQALDGDGLVGGRSRGRSPGRDGLGRTEGYRRQATESEATREETTQNDRGDELAGSGHVDLRTGGT